MGRNSAGVYSLPAGSVVEDGQTTSASQHNDPITDMAADANTARPVVAGGTGASTASAARRNLGYLTFDTRAALVTWWSTNASTTENGLRIFAEGVEYERDSTFTDIPDLANLKPVGRYKGQHFGTVSGSDDEVPLNLSLVKGKATSTGRRGKVVDLPAGLYEAADTIVLPSRCGIRGDGVMASEIQSDGFDGWIIESENFANLTGTNSWYTARDAEHPNEVDYDIPTHITLGRMKVSGNVRPPTSGASSKGGVRLYAKALYLQDLFIDNVDGVGLWTEAGRDVGTNNEWDIPCGNSSVVNIRRTGGHGWVNRGPHDMKIFGVEISEAGYAQAGGGTVDGSYSGLLIQGNKESGTETPYFGLTEFGWVHIYTTYGTGCTISSTSNFNMMISENNRWSDVHYTGTSKNSTIGRLETYGHWGGGDGGFDGATSPGAEPSLNIASGARNIVIGAHECKVYNNAQNAVLIGGENITYNGNLRHIGSNRSAGYGLKVTGDNNDIRVNVDDWQGTGQVGLDIADGENNSVRAVVSNCKTACTISTSVTNIDLDMNVNLESGQEVFDFDSKVNIGALDSASRIKVRGTVDGTPVSSRNTFILGPIDISAIGTTTFTQAHGLVAIPEMKDVQLSLVYETGTNLTWDVLLTVFAIGGTNVIVKATVKTALPGATFSPYISMSVAIPNGV